MQISKNWQVGDVFLNLYQVLEILGDNNVASLYKVRHLSWDTELLVQVPQPKIVQLFGGPENFEAQVKVWVDLGMHPNLVTCYYWRWLERTCLVFTEFVVGSSLHDAIRQGHLYQEPSAQNLARILDIAIQSAWGLHYIHENGAIHQDVCPANLLLSADGVVKLTNLGMIYGGSMVTQASDPANAAPHTIKTDFPGGGMTSAYCSPEQAKLQPLTPSTDSWSWGLLVLEMFQGQRTWSGGTSAAQALKNYQDYQSTLAVSPEMPPMPGEVNWLLRRCFRKNPSARPTLAEIASELTKIYLNTIGVPYPRKQPSYKKETPDNLNNQALSCLDLGAKARALQLWEQALEIQPFHEESIYNRGLILWRSGRISDRALVSKLEKLHRSPTRDSLVDYLLSLVHLERDDAHRALKLLEKISPLWRDRPEIQAALKIAQGRARGGVEGRSPHGMGLIRTFEDHTNLVKSVCFSGDGRHVLSGSDRNTFKLWDVQTGECLRTFSGHTQEVKCVCISGDSKYAISASWDRTLKLWDVQAGTCLRSFQPYANEIFAISLSFDGVYALSGSSERFDLWQIHTGECLRSFAGHKGDIFSLALSRDGKYALSASLDKTIKLWDIHTGNCIRTLHGHQGEVTSVYLSADGNYALSGSSDHTLKLWQLSTGKCLQTLSGHTSEVTSVCLTTDGNYALSGSSDHTIKLWQLSTGRCWRTFEGHTSAVTSICLSPDDTLALSGSMDDTLKLWSVRPPDPPYQAPMRLCSGQSSAKVLDWKEPRQTSALRPQNHPEEIPLVRTLINQRNYIAAAAQIRLLRGRLGKEGIAPGSHGTTPGTTPGNNRDSKYFSAWRQLYVALPKKAFIAPVLGIDLAEITSVITAVALSQDGRYAISCGTLDHSFQLWLLDSGRSLRTFKGHTDQILSVCFNSHSSLVLSGSADKTVKLWAVATGLCVLTLTGHQDAVTSVCFSADENYIISGSGDRTIKFWDIATGKCLDTFKGHYGAVTSVCPSPDGRYILSGSADTTLKIWQIHQGKCLHTFKGHQASVTSVSISADGIRALSGSADKTLKIWQLHEAKCVQTLVGHTDEVTSVCLTPDGRYALSGSRDQTVKIWGQQPGCGDDSGPDPKSSEKTRFLCLHTFMGMTGTINAVSLSADGSYALFGGAMILKLWSLDWELEDRQTLPWDEAARPFLEVFLMLHSQGKAEGEPSDSGALVEGAATSTDKSQPGGIPRDISRGIPRDIPTWTEANFNQLLRTLACAGYGWLEPEGVKSQLETMAANWQWLSLFISEVPDESEEEGTQLTFYAPENQAQDRLILKADNSEEAGTQWLTLAPRTGQIPPDPQESSLRQPPRPPAPQNLPLPSVTLTLESGPLKGRKFQFTSRTTCVIGRAKDCYPQMPNDPSHQTISRYHCLLDINPPAIRIRDLSSRNGTFVNGKIIGKGAKKTTEFECDLSQGDQIKLGYTPLRVQIHHPDPQPGGRSVIFSRGGLAPGESTNSATLPAVKGYTTLKFLGQGRVSQVYLVRHDETGKLLALKVMRPQGVSNPEAIATFLHDLEHLKALHHSNIVQLYDYGYWGDRFFLILEYCQGGTVAKVMQQQGTCLSIDESLGIILQLLNGFDYAHNLDIPDAKPGNIWHENRGVIHGNLEPSNIFFADKIGGNSALVKLGDYALDKAFDLAGLSGLTMTGEQANRPGFTCRQQVLDIKYMQTDLDIWAAAASLYFMLTGRFVRDFTGHDPWLVVLQTEPIPIRDRNPNIPKALAELIDLALVDYPHIHFKKAAAFKRALEAVI